AKKARDAAFNNKKTPVLGHQFARANRMAEAARQQIALRRLNLFDPEIGAGETMMLWREPDGVWCRQLLDWLSDDHRIMADYKTTLESAAPHTLGRKMAVDGWHIQAAMAERGLNNLDNTSTDRRYFFVLQEVEAPYCLSVAEVGADALVIGRKQ